MIDKGMLQAFINAIFTAGDEHGFAKAASGLTEALGYRWFAYISLAEGRPELLSTYPAFWTDHYLESSFDAVDPVISVSRERSGPFLWGAEDGVRPTDREGARLFDDASSFGIRSGVTIPLRGPGGRVAAFTLSTDERSTGGAGRADDLLTAVQTCGMQFHAQLSARVPRFMPEHRVLALTKRQLACLSSSAGGHSAKMTARVVKLTPRTVNHHLEEAKRRLEADTLPHAVALAFRKGLIS